MPRPSMRTSNGRPALPTPARGDRTWQGVGAVVAYPRRPGAPPSGVPGGGGYFARTGTGASVPAIPSASGSSPVGQRSTTAQRAVSTTAISLLPLMAT